MLNNRLFMVVSGAIGACVLLFALFTITVLGITFDSAAYAWIMLTALFVGVAPIYCFYDIFLSRRATTLLWPYKLALAAITFLFAIVEMLLIGSSLIGMMDTGRLDVSGAFFLLILLACVIYVALYALVLYFSSVVHRQQTEDKDRQAIELDLASRLTETLQAYRQFAERHGQLNFSAANRPVDMLSLKTRSIRGLGDYRHMELMHRMLMTCNELLDLFDRSRTEPVDQPCADDVGSKFNAILSDFSLLDSAKIK